MATNIHDFNDWVGSFNQELPLDLTVKKGDGDASLVKTNGSKPVQKKSLNLESENIFITYELPSWYSIYLSIANRQNQYQHQSYTSYGHLVGTEPVYQEQVFNTTGKRKEFPSEIEGKRKQMRSESDFQKGQMSEKVKSSGVWQPTQQSSIQERKSSKKSKKILKSTIDSINRQCDCRGCYEQHILKMRAGSWLGCA